MTTLKDLVGKKIATHYFTMRYAPDTTKPGRTKMVCDGPEIMCHVKKIKRRKDMTRIYVQFDRWVYATLLPHTRDPIIVRWMCTHHGPNSEGRVRSRSKPVLITLCSFPYHRLCDENFPHRIISDKEYHDAMEVHKKEYEGRVMFVALAFKHTRLRELPSSFPKQICNYLLRELPSSFPKQICNYL